MWTCPIQNHVAGKARLSELINRRGYISEYADGHVDDKSRAGDQVVWLKFPILEPLIHDRYLYL